MKKKPVTETRTVSDTVTSEKIDVQVAKMLKENKCSHPTRSTLL